MEHSKQPFLKRLLSVRGMGAALTAFAGLIIIYIAFGLINPTVFSGRSKSVSRDAGAPPRTSTPPVALSGATITVQPVPASSSV